MRAASGISTPNARSVARRLARQWPIEQMPQMRAVSSPACVYGFALEHHLEEARGLHDLPGGFLQLAVLHAYADVAVPSTRVRWWTSTFQIRLHDTPSKAAEKAICARMSPSSNPLACASREDSA